MSDHVKFAAPCCCLSVLWPSNQACSSESEVVDDEAEADAIAVAVDEGVTLLWKVAICSIEPVDSGIAPPVDSGEEGETEGISDGPGPAETIEIVENEVEIDGPPGLSVHPISEGALIKKIRSGILAMPDAEREYSRAEAFPLCQPPCHFAQLLALYGAALEDRMSTGMKTKGRSTVTATISELSKKEREAQGKYIYSTSEQSTECPNLRRAKVVDTSISEAAASNLISYVYSETPCGQYEPIYEYSVEHVSAPEHAGYMATNAWGR